MSFRKGNEDLFTSFHCMSACLRSHRQGKWVKILGRFPIKLAPYKEKLLRLEASVVQITFHLLIKHQETSPDPYAIQGIMGQVPDHTLNSHVLADISVGAHCIKKNRCTVFDANSQAKLPFLSISYSPWPLPIWGLRIEGLEPISKICQTSCRELYASDDDNWPFGDWSGHPFLGGWCWHDTKVSWFWRSAVSFLTSSGTYGE